MVFIKNSDSGSGTMSKSSVSGSGFMSKSSSSGCGYMSKVTSAFFLFITLFNFKCVYI